MDHSHDSYALHGGLDGLLSVARIDRPRSHLQQALHHLKVVLDPVVDFTEQQLFFTQVVGNRGHQGFNLFVLGAQLLH